MVAITHAGTDEGIAWNTKALELARATSDRLLPALLNNLGWDLHELGRYEEALAVFQEALVVYTGRGSVSAIQIAQWSVARCLRSLGRYSEALAIQQALVAEHEAAGTTDAYVLEEIAENQKAIENLSLQK
jgi:tetratricopeptide (TPR) repeat protein